MPAKHFGPFTGRQLTTIICVLSVTIAFPVGAWGAVNASSVFIADNHTGAHAAVDAQANLQTKVNGGSIVDAPALPVNQLNAVSENAGSSCVPLFVVPAGKALVVSAVTIQILIPATTSPTTVALYAAANCGAMTLTETSFDANTHAAFVQPFPSGLAIAGGHELSAVVTGTGSTPIAIFSINGHFVPASQCATGCR